VHQLLLGVAMEGLDDVGAAAAAAAAASFSSPGCLLAQGCVWFASG
jgi:hypothetical protein